MLTSMVSNDIRVRRKRTAFRQWRAQAASAAGERRVAVGKLQAVGWQRVAWRLGPAVVFWRRMTMVKRAERALVRPSLAVPFVAVLPSSALSAPWWAPASALWFLIKSLRCKRRWPISAGGAARVAGTLPAVA